MFDLASIVYKQTKEYEEDKIVSVWSELEKRVVENIKSTKKQGEYSTTIDTGKDTDIEKRALELLRKDLKERGYKVSMIHNAKDRWGWHYIMTIKWSTYTK